MLGNDITHDLAKSENKRGELRRAVLAYILDSAHYTNLVKKRLNTIKRMMDHLCNEMNTRMIDKKLETIYKHIYDKDSRLNKGENKTALTAQVQTIKKFITDMYQQWNLT